MSIQGIFIYIIFEVGNKNPIKLIMPICTFCVAIFKALFQCRNPIHQNGGGVVLPTKLGEQNQTKPNRSITTC